jgi:hypothetical protein
MNIFDELEGASPFRTDDLTVTPPADKPGLRGLDKAKDAALMMAECKRDALTNIYKSDPYVRAEIDAVYGEHAIQSNPHDMSFLSKPNSKPKPIDVMREIKRDVHTKYKIED